MYITKNVVDFGVVLEQPVIFVGNPPGIWVERRVGGVLTGVLVRNKGRPMIF